MPLHASHWLWHQAGLLSSTLLLSWHGPGASGGWGTNGKGPSLLPSPTWRPGSLSGPGLHLPGTGSSGLDTDEVGRKARFLSAPAHPLLCFLASPTPEAEAGAGHVFCPLLGRMHRSWGPKAQPFPQFPLGMSQTPDLEVGKTPPPHRMAGLHEVGTGHPSF